MEEYKANTNGGCNEDANGAQGGCYQHASAPAKKQGQNGCGGYILVGLLCLLVGIALGSCGTALVISGTKIAEDFAEGGASEDPNGGFNFEWHFGENDAMPQNDEEYDEEQNENKEYVARELPAFDGVTPIITDASNPTPDIVEQVFDGVVGINVYYNEDGESTLGGYGSGFVISSEGYVVTNAHVVRGADSVKVAFSDGDEVEAEMIGADTSLDVAVLKVKKTGLTPLALGNSDSVRVGEFTIAIGNPSGSELAGTATFGIVSATSRSINLDGQVNDYLQTDAAINPGNSGGPLLNMKGEVMGITSAKNIYAGYDEYGNAVDAEGLGFAIPIKDAIDVVCELITSGHVERPALGVNVLPIDEKTAAEYDLVEGVLIYSVTKNGPSHKAGIKVNDVVIEYDGTKVTTQDAFVDYIKELKVGDTVLLKVWRDGEELTLNVVLGDRNEMDDELVGGRESDLFD